MMADWFNSKDTSMIYTSVSCEFTPLLSYSVIATSAVSGLECRPFRVAKYCRKQKNTKRKNCNYLYTLQSIHASTMYRICMFEMFSCVNSTGQRPSPLELRNCRLHSSKRPCRCIHRRKDK